MGSRCFSAKYVPAGHERKGYICECLATSAAGQAALHLLELRLELLDLSMGRLEILIETVSLSDELLLPLPETLLLDLDLLGKALAKGLLFLLVLGVVELAGPGLAKLAGLHLLGTVGLVVEFLRRVDQIEHVSPDQNGAQLLEVAVVLILNLGNTPRILTALDDAAISRLDILLGTDDSERYGGQEAACVLGRGLIVLLNRWLVDLDALGLNDSSDLKQGIMRQPKEAVQARD